MTVWIAFGITIAVPFCSNPSVLSGIGTCECMSPTAIFVELRFKIAVRSDRLCILVAGLLDAFVTAETFQRTNRGPGLFFRERMYGKIKMVNALCLPWAHTYQTMCLECQ